MTFYGNEGIISYTKLQKNKTKLKPIRTQHKFLVGFSNLLLKCYIRPVKGALTITFSFNMNIEEKVD